ncbi:Nuclear receptor corepressor 2 [Nibea albiflora]|uniref:Nuclear receptor corepressor 2 n=1 Tax=Nibea albiflora TaxID=240163 RepID=A0ACB7FDC1_NIBAL|nr:Nuclear receptor corepressor 2 [Nibea albiflora]
MEPLGPYRPPSEERLSPGQQPPSPCVKGSQRVVTLAQHISEVITKDYTRQSQQQQTYHGSPVLDLTRPPSASQPPPTSQESAQSSRYPEGLGGERNRDRKLTENTSDIVRSKKQEMIKKMTVVGNEGEFSGGKSSKGSGRSNGRKAKSPGPGLSGGERPSSVSSVHSEGDCNRRTPLTNRVWEDRPSSTGSTPTPFPCNPLIMRFSSGTVSAPSPSSGGQPGGPGPGLGPGQGRRGRPRPVDFRRHDDDDDDDDLPDGRH